MNTIPRTLGAVVGTVIVLGSGVFGISAIAGGGDPQPVKTPVQSPKASVAPDVGKEMNSAGKITMAEGVKMKPITPAKDKKLQGNGDGAGCLKSYGKTGQCVAINPPSGVAMGMQHDWTCAEMITIFKKGVVYTSDPLNLDKNKNKIACDKGDL